MRDYKKYDVWVKAHELTLFIYKNVTTSLPKNEEYALSSQIRRASCSIPLNIVEGCGRSTEKDFVRFLDIALGSVHELEYALLLVRDLGFVSNDNHLVVNEKLNEVKAKLIKLIKLIRQNTVDALR
jgi:four helix bundle protein